MKFISVFLLALCTAVAPAAQELHSPAEINAFFEDATPRKVTVELTGKVLSTFRSPRATETVLADASGARVELYRALDLPQPAPGDTITVRGFASVGQNYEPYVLLENFDVLEHGPCPAPVPVRLAETNAKEHHLLTIRTEGVVIDVFQDGIDHRYMILLLKDSDVIVPVSLPRDVFGDRRDLIDATVRVTGLYRRYVSGARRFSWPNINPRTTNDLEVITPPPSDPFAFPTLEKRLYLSSEDIALMSKRSVTGEVLATWSTDMAMVRTEDGQIVNLKLTSGETLPPNGQAIVAAGQPETDFFRINLSAARWKITSEPFQTMTNETAATGTDAAFWHENGRDSIKSETHGTLIALDGIVRTLPSPGDADLRFVLDTGDHSIPVDVTSNPSVLDGLGIGCKVRVTGRFILLTDARRPDYRNSNVTGFAVVIRSPADITILSRPSWWTPRRLTVVISVLFFSLIVIYIWNRILQHLVNRRGQQLYREQVAHVLSEFKTDERTRLAVELHDSLSQSLAAVACHLAAGDGTFETDPATARSYIGAARKMLNSCRTELRQCLFDLRSDTLEEQDFAVAIRKTLNQVEGDASISVNFDVPRRHFQDTTAHAILAIIRELTNNAIRHGAATQVSIDGQLADGHLHFSVSDNGHGFDPANCDGPLQGHFGLEGIRNRLEKLDGTFTISSTRDTGTRASVTIPLPPAPQRRAAKHE